MKNKNIIWCFKSFFPNVSPKRLVMEGPLESGHQGPDVLKRQESISSSPDIKDVDTIRDAALKTGLDKIDGAQKSADQNEKMEKERKAGRMIEDMLDEIALKFIKEDLSEEQMKQAGPFMENLLKNPDFPGLQYVDEHYFSAMYGKDNRALGVQILNGEYKIQFGPKTRFSD